MVNSDIRILNPLNTLISELGGAEDLLGKLHETITEIYSELGNKKRPKKLMVLVKGPFWSRTKNRLEELNKLITSIGGLIDFYEEYSNGHVTRGSQYYEVRSKWKKQFKETDGCLAAIANLLNEEEGVIVIAVKQNRLNEELGSKVIVVYNRTSTLIGNIHQTKEDLKLLKTQYGYLGIDKSVF